MKRPGGDHPIRARAGFLSRYLMGQGSPDPGVSPGQSYLVLGDWAFYVTGKMLHHKETPGQVLDRLAREHPGKTPVLVRLVDPTMERAQVTLRLEPFAGLLVPALDKRPRGAE